MKKDSTSFVLKCDKCQRFAKITHQPPEELSSFVAHWPFAQWGLDILGPFPLAKAQKKFLIVACEYFTKWIEVEAVAAITQKSVKKFLWENVICRFGIPQRIIIDNGPQLKGDKISQFCSNLHISMNPSSICHPQTNGQVESANKNILNSLRNGWMTLRNYG